MKQQFLDLNGLTELVTYLKKSITEQKEILPYASNKLFPSTGNVNTIYIDTATNSIYRWDSSNKKYEILAKAVKSVSISESTENGKITLTVDGNKTTVPIHGLGSAAYTNSSAYSPAGHTHTKAQVGLGNVDNTADANKSVKHAITANSATTAGTATNVSAGEGTADAARHVWFSDSATETKRAYSDKFKYNPVTNNLTVNVTGNAATASSVAWGNVTGKPSTYAPSAHNHDDSTITSLNASKLFGTIDIARLPHGALERCVIVADDTARFALTTAKIQLGDTVKVNKTQKMYFVIDDSKLNSEAGYTVYTAGTATSVPWSGVTGKPSTFTPSTHTHPYLSALSVSGKTITYTKGDGTTGTITTQDTWRGIQNNLTSTSTTDSLSAAQGKILKGLVDGKLSLSGGTMTGNISYKGSKATYEMIKFIDNSSDTYGNGIAIGGGGLTIIGGGESSDVIKNAASSGGEERLVLANDGAIEFYTNCQDGIDKSVHTTIDNTGLFSGTAANAKAVPWSGVTGKPTSYPPSSHTHAYLPLSGGTMTGALNFANGIWNVVGDDVAIGDMNVSGTLGVMGKNGNTGIKLVQYGASTTGGAAAPGVTWTCTGNGTSTMSGTLSGTFSGNLSGTASRATLLAPAYSSSTLTTTTSTWRNGVTEGNVVWGQSWVDRSLSGDSGDLTIWIKKVNDKITTANMTIDGTITAASGFIGSLSGNASSATALTTSAGSATQPVYFTGGKPSACTYTLGKSVPSNAVFTDTNTKVTQTAIKSSDYTNWRTIPWGSSNNASEGFTPTTVTDVMYSDPNLTYQPSSGTLKAKVFKGSLSGNAATASKLAITASITGGNGNTTGYRLIASHSLAAWSNYRATFIVNSRHEGAGILSVAFGCNAEKVSQANAYGEIRYFGLTSSGSVIASDSFQIYISANGATAYLFEKYWDYSTLSITQLAGDFSVSNGTWVESIASATYGALKASTLINEASSVAWGNVAGRPSAMPASDVYAWAKASSKPSYSWGEITGKPSTFTPASHSHNYAGSSSAGGNANAAVKLATARKIGSASFDGTADITLSQMGLNVPVEITKANYLAKKKAGTLNANTYYNVIDEYDSANVINDSSVTANSAFSSTKSEKTYAKKSAIINTTLTASKWTGSSAPYTYVLPVSGATTSNIVEINYASNASSQAIEAYQNAMLADGGQTTNQITIKATEKPTVDIPITIVIRNDL